MMTTASKIVAPAICGFGYLRAGTSRHFRLPTSSSVTRAVECARINTTEIEKRPLQSRVGPKPTNDWLRRDTSVRHTRTAARLAQMPGNDVCGQAALPVAKGKA
jgi:hypothetical protein